MGQTASTCPTAAAAAPQLQICCKPAISGDSSPISVGRLGEALPTLLSTPTAGALNDEKKVVFDDTTAEDDSAALEPKAAVADPEEVEGHVSDAATTFAELDAADGPNRASCPSPTQEGLLENDGASDDAVEAEAAAAPPQEQAEEQQAPQAQPAAKRTREERKELRRQQRGNAKERLRPFLTKNGFVGPNTPRRRLFRTQFPIHAAVNQNNAEVVKLLIIAGVDITKVDSSGRTAQELARREHSRHNSHAQVLALLTEAQRRRAARMARKSQAAEAAADGQQPDPSGVQHVSSEASALGNIGTTSTATTTASIEGGL